MKYGVSIFVTDTSIRPDQVARETEARGFNSIWFPEHSHIPAARKSPWGGVEGAAPLPDQYWRTLDQYVALGVAAAATTTLKVGAGISLVAQRDPIWTAKEAATVDFLSDGRLLFGIGYGWNKEEMASHGTSYLQRRALLREKVLMIKSLWNDEEASFDGDLMALEPSWAYPKPVQRPNPPIIMGAAAGPKTIGDMAEFCDGWMPLANRHDIPGQIARVKEAVDDAGRDPESFQIIANGAKISDIETLEAAGVDEAIFILPPLGADVNIPRLDKLATEAGLI
jgi:probable F420-dependent oxidoreductase